MEIDWGGDGTSTAIEADPPTNKPEDGRWHRVYDGGDYANTRITGYIFMGESREISSYRNLLLGVYEALYRRDPDRMASLARRDANFHKAKKLFISYDRAKLREPREIAGSGIYIETNKSADTIVKDIAKLLPLFGVSPNDLVFYASK